MNADFRVTIVRGRATVCVKGEVDVAAAERFRDALQAALDGSPDVIVDLRQLSFLDYSGITALVNACRQADAGGGSLRAVGANQPVRRVFELLRLADLLVEQEQRLTWRQVTPAGGGWRQWVTGQTSTEGVPVAEILEVGSWAGYDSEDAHYVLETDGRTGLYGCLEDAMTAAENPESVTPLSKRPSPTNRHRLEAK